MINESLPPCVCGAAVAQATSMLGRADEFARHENYVQLEPCGHRLAREVADRWRADRPRLVDRVDVIKADGTHRYWSTHCRHDRHDDCSADELTGLDAVGPWQSTIKRQPAQCKTCAAPCIGPCHTGGADR